MGGVEKGFLGGKKSRGVFGSKKHNEDQIGEMGKGRKVGKSLLSSWHRGGESRKIKQPRMSNPDYSHKFLDQSGRKAKIPVIDGTKGNGCMANVATIFGLKYRHREEACHTFLACLRRVGPRIGGERRGGRNEQKDHYYGPGDLLPLKQESTKGSFIRKSSPT